MQEKPKQNEIETVSEQCPRCASRLIGKAMECDQDGSITSEWMECGDCEYQWTWNHQD